MELQELQERILQWKQKGESSDGDQADGYDDRYGSEEMSGTHMGGGRDPRPSASERADATGEISTTDIEEQDGDDRF